MPHIPGHIDTSNSSFGILKPVRIINKTADITNQDIVDFPILTIEPPSTILKLVPSGTYVGFLPIFLSWGDNRFIVLASDLAPLSSYNDAEKWMEKMLAELGSPNTKIEEATSGQLDKIKTRSHDLPNKQHADLVIKMANYLSGAYLNKPYKGTKEPNDVIDWITRNAVPIQEMFSEKILDRLRELVLAKKQN